MRPLAALTGFFVQGNVWPFSRVEKNWRNILRGGRKAGFHCNELSQRPLYIINYTLYLV